MREIRTLRATWRGLETWHGRATCRRASPRPYRRAGCGNGVTATPLRHRQTKEAATDMFNLPPPRHISTLPHCRNESGHRFLTFCADIVAKLFSRLPTRNIDSRTSQSAQYRIRNAGFPASIIARWQRSKEFCNKIGTTRTNRLSSTESAFGGKNICSL